MSALRDLHLGAGRCVPASCLSVTYARSGGPGGQHVNKTETKVDVRIDLERAVEHLGADAVARLREKLATRLDADGRLYVTCDEHRSQRRNLDAALDRLEELLVAALRRPKVRRPTRPTRGSQVRRMDEKRRRGDVKRGRRGDHDD